MAQVRPDSREEARDGRTFNVLLENDKEANMGAETFGYEPIYHYWHVDRRVVDDHEEFELRAGNRGRSGGIRVDLVEGYCFNSKVLQQRTRPYEFDKWAEVGKVAHAEVHNFGGRQVGIDAGQETVLSKDCTDECELLENSERGEYGD